MFSSPGDQHSDFEKKERKENPPLLMFGENFVNVRYSTELYSSAQGKTD